jgi:hypothetical protein
MASGAEGLAGLSAARGGGGAVAHPARSPTAIKGIEHRFMIEITQRHRVSYTPGG